jgi:hypothetical protein
MDARWLAFGGISDYLDGGDIPVVALLRCAAASRSALSSTAGALPMTCHQ